jgi:hypothetical protein
VKQTCLQTNRLKTAAQYLLVLHTLRPIGEDDMDPARSRSDAAIRLFEVAQATGDVKLCKELLRFLRAADDTGATLQVVVEKVGLLKVDVSEDTASVAE